MREPVLESERYQLFMDGHVVVNEESGGEYGSFLCDTFRWEGQGVIVEKGSGKSIQFCCSTDTQRDNQNLTDSRSVILRTSHLVRDERVTWRRALVDEVCLQEKFEEIVDLICEDLLSKMAKDPDPIKRVHLQIISHNVLLTKGLVADQNDQIPLLVS